MKVSTRLAVVLSCLLSYLVAVAGFPVLAQPVEPETAATSPNGKKILITGFEPFQGSTANISGDLVTELKKEVEDKDGKIGGLHIRTLVLKVEWGDPVKRIEEKIKEIEAEGQQVAAILGLGQTCAKGIEIETEATNERKGKDEAGNRPSKEVKDTIDPDRKKGASYETSFTEQDRKDFKAAAEATGVDASLDDDPGEYLCNEAFYTSLELMSTDGGTSGGKALFVHLERYPHKNKDRSDPKNAAKLAEMKKAVVAVLEKMAAAACR